MKRRTEFYAALASRRFLEGTPYHSPFEAVKAGARRIEDWCDCLGQTRSASGWPEDAGSGEVAQESFSAQRGGLDSQHSSVWEP